MQKFKFWERFGSYQQLQNDKENPPAPAAVEADEENQDKSVYYSHDDLDEMVCGEGKEKFESQIEFEKAALEVEEQAKVKKVKEEEEGDKLAKRLERLEELNQNMMKQMEAMMELLVNKKKEAPEPTID